MSHLLHDGGIEMTLNDDPTEKNTDEVEHAPDDEVAVVEAPPQTADLNEDEILEQLFSAMSASDGASYIASLAVLAQTSGPLPPPQILQYYNEIIPNGADRIMVMSERAQAALIEGHREGRRAEQRGQFFAFICVLAVLSTGIVLAVTGQSVTGFGLTSFSLATMVYAFVRGRD